MAKGRPNRQESLKVKSALFALQKRRPSPPHAPTCNEPCNPDADRNCRAGSYPVRV